MKVNILWLVGMILLTAVGMAVADKLNEPSTGSEWYLEGDNYLATVMSNNPRWLRVYTALDLLDDKSLPPQNKPDKANDLGKTLWGRLMKVKDISVVQISNPRTLTIERFHLPRTWVDMHDEIKAILDDVLK